MWSLYKKFPIGICLVGNIQLSPELGIDIPIFLDALLLKFESV